VPVMWQENTVKYRWRSLTGLDTDSKRCSVHIFCWPKFSVTETEFFWFQITECLYDPAFGSRQGSKNVSTLRSFQSGLASYPDSYSKSRETFLRIEKGTGMWI
jgi:hypothetical protein